MKKIYKQPQTEVVKLNLKDSVMMEQNTKIPVGSTPADDSIVFAKGHNFGDNVGEDVWQRGNNNGFKSWEDE